MKTSARNQYTGTISAIVRGSVNDEVHLRLPGGQLVVAIVTHESVTTLPLETGREAVALIKSSSIVLVTETDGIRLSARNQLHGKIAKIQTGAVNTEIVLELDGGGTLAAIITKDSAATMGLQLGTPATAIFKASSVILAVPA